MQSHSTVEQLGVFTTGALAMALTKIDTDRSRRLQVLRTKILHETFDIPGNH